MLDGVPVGGCPAGYKLNSAANDCDADPDSNVWSDPRKTEIIVVKAKKPKADWNWAGFWSRVVIPTVNKPQSGMPPEILAPSLPPLPFWKTPTGIALIVLGVGGIIVAARKK